MCPRKISFPIISAVYGLRFLEFIAQASDIRHQVVFCCACSVLAHAFVMLLCLRHGNNNFHLPSSQTYKSISRSCKLPCKWEHGSGQKELAKRLAISCHTIFIKKSVLKITKILKLIAAEIEPFPNPTSGLFWKHCSHPKASGPGHVVAKRPTIFHYCRKFSNRISLPPSQKEQHQLRARGLARTLTN